MAIHPDRAAHIARSVSEIRQLSQFQACEALYGLEHALARHMADVAHLMLQNELDPSECGRLAEQMFNDDMEGKE